MSELSRGEKLVNPVSNSTCSFGLVIDICCTCQMILCKPRQFFLPKITSIKVEAIIK